MNVDQYDQKQSKTTEADWAKLAGVNCSTYGKELLKVYGPMNQCSDCFYKLKDVMLEEKACPKCSEMAAKATTISMGLLDEKIICPRCGTFSTVK
jgi:hypothetical protein